MLAIAVVHHSGKVAVQNTPSTAGMLIEQLRQRLRCHASIRPFACRLQHLVFMPHRSFVCRLSCSPLARLLRFKQRELRGKQARRHFVCVSSCLPDAYCLPGAGIGQHMRIRNTGCSQYRAQAVCISAPGIVYFIVEVICFHAGCGDYACIITPTFLPGNL